MVPVAEWEAKRTNPKPAGWSSWLLTELGAALDGVLLRGLRFAVRSALRPDPAEAAAIRKSAAPYLDAALQQQPGRFFDFLSKPARPAQVSERFVRALPGGGAVVQRWFLSDYEPFFHTEDRGRIDPDLRNERVPVQHWMHQPGPPRATVLALHGFTMGQPRIDAVVMMAWEWYRRGLDVAMMTLPYHGARSPRGSRFSGERFASPYVSHLNEAVRQAVHDTRRVLTWLSDRTQRPVGLLGLSLGGYISALFAGLSDDPAFVVPMVPPVSIADLGRRFLEDGGLTATSPLSPSEREKAYGIHSPLAYPARVPQERLMIVAGRGDRVVPPEHPRTLWEHWGRPRIHWFSGSHLAPFGRSRIVAEIAAHIAEVGL